jgi:mono/diheme cytochrome c family protein
MVMRRSLLIGVGALSTCGIVAAAGDASSKPSYEPPTEAPVLRGRTTGGGSGIALADFNGTTIALVADEDDSSIRVFETKKPKEIAVAKVPGVPSQVIVTKTGKVLVALRDKGTVAILEPKGGDARTLVQRGSIDTGGEPVAIATTPDEATLVVASGWTHEVSAYTLADRTLKTKVNVAREPRSIAMASDGSKAYVTHAVGAAISAVDLAAGTSSTVSTSASGTTSGAQRTRVGTQGFAAVASRDGKIFVPTVFADPGAPETYYGSGLEVMGVAVLDEVSGSISAASQVYGAATGYPNVERCILPRTAAVSADGKKLLVGCAGDSDLEILDAKAGAPRNSKLGTKNVGDSPAAIAIDDQANTVISWSQMGRTLTVGDLGDKPAPSQSVAASPASSLVMAVARGRRLFHAVDGKVAADGRACASCHTDGRDDGLTWHTPEGDRQTPMLAARLQDTAPYGWTRDAKTFHEYVTGTVSRLRGKGFSKDELDDLQAYVMSLKAPPKAKDPDEAVVKHGAEVFASSGAGCASCHTGAATTDGKKHVVDKVGTQDMSYQTPSLRFVGGTGPYFHDGRYATLRALLTSNDPNMGKAKDLPSQDLDALEAYLKSL